MFSKTEEPRPTFTFQAWNRSSPDKVVHHIPGNDYWHVGEVWTTLTQRNGGQIGLKTDSYDSYTFTPDKTDG